MEKIPGIYFHSEPLTYTGKGRVRDPLKLIDALNTLRQLLQCNYTGLARYRKHSTLKTNTRLRKICAIVPSLCRNWEFLSGFCRVFPFQIMNLVQVEFSEPLLTDPESNVKMVMLVRDPRGNMESRMPLPWCRASEECINSDILCRNMVSACHFDSTIAG